MSNLLLATHSVQPTRLSYLVQRHAEMMGNTLVWEDLDAQEAVSYQILLQNTKYAIGKIRSFDLQKGDVICFILTRSKYFFPLLIACVELGLVLAPVEEDPAEVKIAIESLHPKLVLYQNEMSIMSDTSTDAFSIQNFMKREEEQTKEVVLDVTDLHGLREEPALLIKTSGTTGQAKFVELSEKNLAWNAYYLQNRFACKNGERILCTLPWSHMNAIMITGCLGLVAGATTVYRNIMEVANPIEAMRSADVRIASLTPTLLAFLLKRKKTEQNLSFLRFCFCGAAPLGAELWKKAEIELGCPIYQGYGLSETTCWITASADGEQAGYDNVGTLLAGNLRIHMQKNIQPITHLGDTEVRHELGEIQFQGPLLMCGYRFLNGKRSVKLTEDGFFSTGDVGYIDEQNRVHVVGRVKEIIIRSGINIVPESVDVVMRQHPQILDSKTVGIPDELLGEKVVTAYVTKPDTILEAMELRRFATEQLPRLMVPNQFVKVGHLPRTRVGKIAIGELRKLVSGEYANQTFKALNTWRFKREQPQQPETIIQSFQKKILLDQPLSFVAYWGAGRKTKISTADQLAMERLREFVDIAAKESGRRAELQLILTDVHAYLNGKPHERVEMYLQEIEKLSLKYGFSCTRSSSIWQKEGLELQQISLKADGMKLEELVDNQGLEQKTLQRLLGSAEKHVEQGKAEVGLKRYLLACKSERSVFAKKYQGAVFLTYNNSEMNFLTPPLPTLQISSYRKDTAVKPWFSLK